MVVCESMISGSQSCLFSELGATGISLTLNPMTINY